ncbi:hypothetical protein [Flavobacterium sp.]|uniref:hypothetical protein n=1 Tax=Flavobacterium sp. TaxID=239 RepID=UPI003750B5EF
MKIELSSFNTSEIRKKQLLQFLKVSFFTIVLIELYFEYFDNIEFISLLKPLLIPIIIIMYWGFSEKKSIIYVFSLSLSWIANVLFISKDVNIISLAALFFILHRVFIIYKIYLVVKPIKWFSILLASIPFLFLFLCLINVVFIKLEGKLFYITLTQSLLMSLYGGFALSNYIMKNDQSSKLLLVSSIFFTLNLFALGIKLYFIDLSFLKPISMLFFILGQYILYLFMINSEKEEIKQQ